ncbi:hypothetical protein BGW41_000670 [Actinomortierella wolfii]|nr:hypothetical protein BGW41_000670 [Actinomortierella wolfii]
MASPGGNAQSPLHQQRQHAFDYDAVYSESGTLPPSYEEAIAQYEQSLSPEERQRQRFLTEQRQQQEPRPPSVDLQPEDHDPEDEEAYNESRPLRQGTVPNTFAQVTHAPAPELPSSSTAGPSLAYAPPPPPMIPGAHLHHPHHHLHHPHFAPHYGPFVPPGPTSTGQAPDPTSAAYPMAPNGAPYPPPGPFPFHGPPPPGAFPMASRPSPSPFAVDAKQPIMPPSAPPLGSSSTSSAQPSSSPSSSSSTIAGATGIPGEPSYQSASPTQGRDLVKVDDISIATFHRTKVGVESEDPILEDPYQLYRFLVAHNDRPSLHVLITGHHTERRHSSSKDSDGHVSTTTYTTKVEDFKISFDLSEYVSTVGTLYTVPNPKTGRKQTLREAMEEYAQDDNAFKEFHMEKHVVWDYEELKKAITHAIRSVHYRYTIEISFPTQNSKVIVRSASPAATFMRNTWTKVFCCLTLIGAIAYPLRACYKRVKDKSVRSSFNVNLTPREFYNMHYWDIVNAVQYK